MSFVKLVFVDQFKQPTFTFASWGVPKIANATSVHISKIMIMIDENATKKKQVWSLNLTTGNLKHLIMSTQIHFSA